MKQNVKTTIDKDYLIAQMKWIKDELNEISTYLMHPKAKDTIKDLALSISATIQGKNYYIGKEL